MKKHYIKAIVQLILQGRDVNAVLVDLDRVLTDNGHGSLKSSILKGVAVELESRSKTDASSVIVASESAAVSQKDAIERTLEKLGGSFKDAVVTVDPTIIGGYIASHNATQINNSHKEKLVSLYRSITK